MRISVLDCAKTAGGASSARAGGGAAATSAPRREAMDMVSPGSGAGGGGDRRSADSAQSLCQKAPDQGKHRACPGSTSRLLGLGRPKSRQSTRLTVRKQGNVLSADRA